MFKFYHAFPRLAFLYKQIQFNHKFFKYLSFKKIKKLIAFSNAKKTGSGSKIMD